MAINQPKQTQGIMGSKAFKVAEGYATGGPAGAGLALASSQGGPGGQLAGMASKAGVGGASGGYDPIKQRIASQQSDPGVVVDDTLNMLKDPSVPQELRDQYAPELLRLKVMGGYGSKAGRIA